MQDDPRVSRLLLVESLAAGARVSQRRAQALEQLAKIIDQGRQVKTVSQEPPQITAEAVVGGVLAMLHTRVLQERYALTELLGPLMSMIVLPYLGAEAASEELCRPGPQSRSKTRSKRPATGRDPLAGLDIRLTYRTVRVLTAIAEHPAASNREVAARSGIGDRPRSQSS